MHRMLADSAMPGALIGGVAAIGNFDGFHLGHQAVVGRAMSRARAVGLPAIVVTFDPHPVRFFAPARAPFLLTSIEKRVRLMEDFGVDGVVVLSFDESLARLDAEEFIAKQLAGRLSLSGCVTGSDFTFGARRSGDVETLRSVGRRFGIAAEALPPVREGAGATVSSTLVRSALAEGRCLEAERLLGRRHRLAGVPKPRSDGGCDILFDAETQRLATGRYSVLIDQEGASTRRAVIHSDPDGGMRLNERVPDGPIEVEFCSDRLRDQIATTSWTRSAARTSRDSSSARVSASRS